MSENSKVAVLGAGGWGFAIANLLRANSHSVILWEFDPQACDQLRSTRELPLKLPGVSLDSSILVTDDLSMAVGDSDFICCVVPSQFLRSSLRPLGKLDLRKKPVFVNLAKGIEVGSLRRMSEVIAEEIPSGKRSGICTLSGPSHAEEVSRQMPTAITAASDNAEIAGAVQKLFVTPYFRVYSSLDILGVELAGSLKNVIALAAGMLDGLGMGDNTRGALLTRGLAEMVRLGKNMGADPLTFSGLSGVGDLVTTCLSKHSRNRFVGDQVGRGRKLKQVLSEMTMVAEGVETTRSANELALRQEIEMPIASEVYKVLFDDKPPSEAISDLMTREPKPERWS